MKKPLLLGIDNPHSTDPRAALLPRPKGSAGHRLFKMASMKWSVYKAAFDRANVSDVISSNDVCEELNDRVVVVLGKMTWRRLSMPNYSQPFDKVRSDFYRSTFILVPHPSGKNLFYNEPSNRESVTRLLRRLAREYQDRT